tara:strand:- start:3722 stop:4510 length:789 start_codon:yes stop_codon:yes gene_type:complete
MDYINNIKKPLTDFIYSEGKISVIIKAIIAIIIVIYLVNLMVSYYLIYKKWSTRSPFLVKNTKNGQKQLVIKQDPSNLYSITINRSENMKNGIEFTYVMWIYIDNWRYKMGKWKHILHKGNETSWPLEAPGIWLHPKENKLRVYMNTFKNIGEYVDISDIPLKKWFQVTVAVKNKTLDVYINASLVKSHILKSIPKQNWGDIYINSYGGFGGYVSNIKYLSEYISISELEKHFSTGPTGSFCVDSGNKSNPRYLSSRWILNN